MKGIGVLIVLPLAAVVYLQRGGAAQRVNLAALESTTLSVSSVNGKREQTNRYYGVRNLVDGGRNVVEGLTYTTWLSDQDASHWIKLAFRESVDIESIMLELPAAIGRPVSRRSKCLKSR